MLVSCARQPHLVHAHLVGQRIEGGEQPGGEAAGSSGQKDKDSSMDLFGAQLYGEP